AVRLSSSHAATTATLRNLGVCVQHFRWECQSVKISEDVCNRKDLIGLRWADWKEDGLHVKTRKTGRYLLFARSQALVETLDQAKKLSSAIFGNMPILPCQGGGPFTPSGFKSNWQRLMRKAAAQGTERFHFHDLRAVAASRHATPQELLGHDDPRTTNRIYRRGPRLVEPADILEITPFIGNRPKPKVS
ncbi:MAG: tyrosine-type recombinase/integrase, partial [Acidiferrobacter sp.]